MSMTLHSGAHDVLRDLFDNDRRSFLNPVTTFGTMKMVWTRTLSLCLMLERCDSSPLL